jgi:hypothetical protein
MFFEQLALSQEIKVNVFQNFFTGQCGISKPCVSAKIFNGTNSCDGEFPWMVKKQNK